MILQLPNPTSTSRWADEQRTAGRSIGFVPTMGALHQGHVALVRRAVADNDVACASIFVNPLQFNDPGDLERYPRDQEGDVRRLDRAGCAMVFFGTLAGFFPDIADPANIELEDPGPCAAGLEGEFRPGHLAGVRTIVERLFRTIGDCRAYFGEKDFQQTLVVRDLARRLGFPEIVVCPTVREPSGLAMSSRNTRLGDDERERAVVLFQALVAARRAWRSGERDPVRLGEIMRSIVEPVAGVELEYAAVRDPDHWTAGEPPAPLARARALIAARVGPVRLIDNLSLDEPDPLDG
jgi:pantoate--beta-alanine ligase